ncbi:aromatic hydrocarbon degradation protein [Photobacterium damselae subsp. damselae]|nr:outer membrane protein transport protein [Photobacterium damselae]NVH50418.1 outer membrane protein transport protein [Photobacterium damselae subsp. damselae]NVO83195.1 outer membrane protein transport protein [Photobacterium damselae subsp. damselae]TLS82985.1 aromatic hydrocarbon degradation protein [Photobacterium damselae subsp. damselae]TLS90491.1 aromatic hydrocarbon degradation protein [Photobacterium damselae subsp. damselae]
MNKQKITLSLAAAVALGLTSNAMAAGFQLAEYSATGLGRAFAGEAAMADNASTQFRNPAMLTYLEGTQISTGAIYVNPNIDVNGTVNSRLSQQPIQTSSKDFANSAVVPNLYISHQLNDQLFLGFALSTNYGMETKLSNNFAANQFGNEANVKTVEANANFGYKLNEQLSLGLGVRYAKGKGHFGAQAPNYLPKSGIPDLHVPPAGTTLAYMEGKDSDWGWQAGAVWQINPNNRIGLSYKSKMEMNFEGHAEGFMFNGQKLPGTLSVPLPATAEIATFHQINDKLALHTSINWTDWSSFKSLTAELPIGATTIKEEHWKDNYRFAVGATYQYTNKLALRSGIAYDMAAVNDKNRTATIPETDRTWFSVGAGYQWSENLTFDAGLTYILAKDASIKEPRGYESDNAAAQLGTFKGEVSGDIWLAGVQASYKF